ncbi:sorbosone dehydrogenase family protein [Nocardioides sp.]|uniref:PQQ-dependent sugar dehydrogenase n=1 Tax=Nocardioides sp. TaxID=35761 RepID=UPI002732C6C3|nr:PQQ-dependent sugar dehydrogenase [Nocardioides sp.]MDP3891400.1 PQQ-dependent sugar dehydrogenase [Nocardioides sp.]
MRRPRVLAPALTLVTALALTGCGGQTDDNVGGPTVTASPDENGDETTPDPDGSTAQPGRPKVVETVATGLEVPWGLAFLPDTSALVTERDSGRVLAVERGSEPREVGRIDEVDASGSEAGLLGIVASPDFSGDELVFLYVTTSEDNRVVRATYDGERLGDTEVILDGIPNGNIHDGGRMVFGPDGYLYVSTGEIGEPELAQDRASLGGKILRIDEDGNPAPDNPDPDSPVFSWGHRNVQGLAFDDDGNLWASEFGANAFDELNLIEAGENYGWPEVEGRGDKPQFVDPQVVWNTDEASPSGLAYVDGHLWLAALRGQRLWRVGVDAGTASEPTDFFVGKHGRIRTVAVDYEGNLWVTTSNRDGRGDPSEDDDQILLVTPGG